MRKPDTRQGAFPSIQRHNYLAALSGMRQADGAFAIDAPSIEDQLRV